MRYTQTREPAQGADAGVDATHADSTKAACRPALDANFFAHPFSFAGHLLLWATPPALAAGLLLIAAEKYVPDSLPATPVGTNPSLTNAGYKELPPAARNADRQQRQGLPASAAALPDSGIPPLTLTHDSSQLPGNHGDIDGRPDLTGAGPAPFRGSDASSSQQKPAADNAYSSNHAATTAAPHYNPLRPATKNSTQLAAQRKQRLPRTQQVAYGHAPAVDAVAGSPIDHAMFQNSAYSQLNPVSRKRFRPVPVMVRTPRKGLNPAPTGNDRAQDQSLQPYPAVTYPPGVSTPGNSKTATTN